MPDCKKCDTMPLPLPRHGRLYIWPPVAHTGGKIIAEIRKSGHDVINNVTVSTLYTDFDIATLPHVMQALNNVLLPEEMADTKALIMDSTTEPGVDDIARVTSLYAIHARIGASWLVDVLSESRLRSVFQPIFAASNLKTPFSHECLIRAVDSQGNIIAPDRLFGAASSAELVFQLDRAARAANVRNAHAAGIDNIFINFTPSSIYDPNSCLRSTLQIIDDCGFDRSKVVFEVIETEKIHSTDHLRAILKSYRDSGFRVALDDVGSGYSTLNMLSQLQPDIIKIDRELIDYVDQDIYKQAIVSKLIDLAKQIGIEVVAEGVERQAELDFLLHHKVDYIQGFLLGRPAPTRFGANNNA
ncbi:signal peptide protein [Thalassospira profundimaris]|uniref:Signal peptide protein n=1 Tax=Thalassospira profundimaris TaxID=502049 RepID=A0A367XJG8_9PROT|nr:EAL domain-containing protein [Thalassospira profundimaris]RCK53796.1 signal peptide protein [Thalassospira profundimaris]